MLRKRAEQGWRLRWVPVVQVRLHPHEVERYFRFQSHECFAASFEKKEKKMKILS